MPAPSRAPPRRQAAHPTMVRNIAIIILSLVILLGLIVLITWLAIHPRKLKYSIERGSITNYNLTNARLNADFDFMLRADNPNKRVSLYYDKIDVAVSYEDHMLSLNNVHPFHQPRKNVTHLKLDLTAKNATVFGDVARDMGMESKSGNLELDVNIRAKIRFKIGVFKIHRILEVSCGPLIVPVGTSKGYKGDNCRVDVDWR